MIIAKRPRRYKLLAGSSAIFVQSLLVHRFPVHQRQSRTFSPNAQYTALPFTCRPDRSVKHTSRDRCSRTLNSITYPRSEYAPVASVSEIRSLCDTFLTFDGKVAMKKRRTRCTYFIKVFNRFYIARKYELAYSRLSLGNAI